jgi:hypothetical protein
MPLHPSLKKPIIEIEKSSLRGTKPLLQFYAPRLSLEAKHNLAKKKQELRPRENQKPQMPSYTSTYLIHYIYTKLAVFGSSKKNMLKPLF